MASKSITGTVEMISTQEREERFEQSTRIVFNTLLAIDGQEIQLTLDDSPRIEEGDEVTVAGPGGQPIFVAYAYINHTRSLVGYNGKDTEPPSISLGIGLALGAIGLAVFVGLIFLLQGGAPNLTAIAIALFMLVGVPLLLWGVYIQTRQSLQMSSARAFVRKRAPEFERVRGQDGA